jgi:uncharacterized protein
MLSSFRFPGLPKIAVLFVLLLSISSWVSLDARATPYPFHKPNVRQHFGEVDSRSGPSWFLSELQTGGPEAQPPTRFEQIVSRVKNNSLIATLLLLGTIIIALGTFTDALTHLNDFIRRNRPDAARAKLGPMSLEFTSEDFIESVRRNDLHAVKIFLAARMDPNARGGAGNTALIEAVKNGYTEIVHALLKSGADVNAVGSYSFSGYTALDFAMPDKKELFRLLWRKGATADTVNRTFVTAARHLDTNYLKILLHEVPGWNAGLRADLKAVGGKALIAAVSMRTGTPMHDEIRNTVRFLLDRGVDPNFSDPNSSSDAPWTALHGAAYGGHSEAVQALLKKGADINATFYGGQGNMLSGNTPLMMAIQEKHCETARLLLEQQVDINHKNDKGETALIIAANERYSGGQSLSIIRALLERGADLEVQTTDSNGSTALMKAAFNGLSEVVRIFLEAGADANKKSKEGRTALHFAAKWGDADMITALLQHRADPNVRDYIGVTPLMRAAKYNKPNVVSLLLRRGASVSETDITGKTAMHFAEERDGDSEEVIHTKGEITRLLRDAGGSSLALASL